MTIEKLKEESSDIINTKAEGYQGIWFTLGQYQSKYGDKYSGGFATYTAKHRPTAVYSKEANKTFFVYGGTYDGKQHLLAMASYYDHATGLVPKPTIVHDKEGVTDPHDNPSICLDKDGYVWVFVSGRARGRPGFIYRSVKPYSVEKFEVEVIEEITYPQPCWLSGKILHTCDPEGNPITPGSAVHREGFLLCFTKYTAGRELYWSTSPDGRTWNEHRKLVGYGGHYQTTSCSGKRVITAFNYHPGTVDKRTNLYFLQTDDFGCSWKTIQGDCICPPLDKVQNEALVRDYEAEKRLVYMKDITFDTDGNPVILYLVSQGSEPGPQNGLRIWTTARWTGQEWDFREITTSDHNYDMGSLYIHSDGVWRVVAPTEKGPQPHGTGGEIVIWTSNDKGDNWTKIREVTRGSKMNHGYVKRPVNAHPDFYAFWADGDPFKFSESRLFFCNEEGDKVFVLPYHMKADMEEPTLVI